MFNVGEVVRIRKINSKHFMALARVIKVMQELENTRFVVSFGKRGRPPIFKEMDLERFNHD